MGGLPVASACASVRTEDDDTAAVVPVKVDALRHLATCDGEEDGAPPAVAGPLVVVQRQRRLHDVLRLDEQQLVGLRGAAAGQQCGVQSHERDRHAPRRSRGASAASRTSMSRSAPLACHAAMIFSM